MCHREANRFPFIAIDSSLLAEKQPLPKLDDSIIELYKGVGKLLNKYTAGKNALEPHMSKETLEYHWGKHHRGYVDNLNKQIVGTELDGLTSEGVVLVSYNTGDILPAFDNAAQTWNYEFFWESMAPGGGGKPSGDLLKLINRDLGPSKLLLKNSSWQHLLSLVLVGPGLHRFAAFMAPLVSGRLTGGSGAMYSAKTWSCLLQES